MNLYIQKVIIKVITPLVISQTKYEHISDFENYPLIGKISPLHKTQTMGMIKQLEKLGIPHEKLLFDETRADGKHAFLIQSLECQH